MRALRAVGAASERRVWRAVFGVALIGWAVTIGAQRSMATMTITDLGLGWFALLWLPMMAAMMLPSVAPTAQLWIRSISRTPARSARLAGFAAGYLVAWTMTAVPAYGLATGIDALHRARWLTPLALLIAGLYQMTPLKRVCLRNCRSPISSLLHYASFRPPLRDVRAGISHGSYCVGCCWGLMGVLLVLGAMDVWLMAGLMLVVALEKTWSRGESFSRAAAAVLVAAAAVLAVLAHT